MNLFSRFQGLWNATRAIYIWSTSLRDSDVFSDGEYKREGKREREREKVGGILKNRFFSRMRE